MGGPAVVRRTNLPAELSSFVGRRHELAQIRAAVLEYRLVTLFGPGGVGKTRLAYRSAADLSDRFADGVWVVELAPVHDPALVPDTLVAALGLRDVATGASVDRLVRYLREREALVVVDNCEHVQDAAAELLATLVAACPGLHVMATSRHELGLPGEHLLPVPPMRVPRGGHERSTSASLLHYDSVRLFVDRATASWPSFDVAGADPGALAELVRRLDGVPLAIELASVRVRSLSVSQIVERLADRFALLSRGDRSALPRQQTLRALIDWSHELLEEPERLVWARATVFSGSFDVAAVQRVVCDERVPPQDAAALLESLVSKSIVVREGVNGSTRYHLLESLKEYGRSRLEESGALEDFVERHREHYLDLAARAAGDMFGPQGVAWFRRLRADHDNLRACLEECLADPRLAVDGLRMMGHLQHYWVMAGRFGEGRLWLDRLLERADPSARPSAEHAGALEVAGRLAVLQGDVTHGRPLLEEALEEAAGAESRTWRAHALHGLALAAVFWGEPSEAVHLLEEALALHRGGEDPFGAPLALVQLATVRATLGEPDRAMAHAQECVDWCERAAEQWCAGLARWTQALVAWHEGKPARTRSSARDVLRLKEPFGDRLGMAMSLEVLAWVASSEGRPRLAATLLGAADAALRSVGGALFRHLVEDHERCVGATRDALGPAEFDRVVAAGGALPFDEAVAIALGRRPVTGDREALAGPAAQLTRREREIARLVARGLTNREVAETLVLAQRTAEGHVARILAKLGFTSRTQLAAWVAEHLGAD
jgi:predicted ATPase/DNA-binding CsgD family transcriptional regulator